MEVGLLTVISAYVSIGGGSPGKMSRGNVRITQQWDADFLFCPWGQKTPATPLARPSCNRCRLAHFVFSSVFLDLGVTLDQELTFAPHIRSLCRDSYYQLHQRCTVVRPLISDTTATLIHTFITLRLDYCSSLASQVAVPKWGPALCCTPLWTLPQIWPYLQLYVGCAPLAPLQQTIPYQIIALAWWSVVWLALAYLRDFCCTTLSVPGCHSLHSTEQGFVIVFFAHTTTNQNFTFSVVGPLLWNGLSLALRLFPRAL